MNREYRKFNEPAEEYYPPATAPDHFSHLPDVLIPEDYREPERDPLEKDIADLIRESKTPPPTPPELEPGRARCRMFHEVKHYVDPCYQNPDFQIKFTTRLILASMCLYVPTAVSLVIFMLHGDLDYIVLNNPTLFVILFIGSIFGITVYIYFVGLFRNYPVVYMAVGGRIVLQTILFTSGMLLIHAIFLNAVGHPDDEEAERNLTSLGHFHYEVGDNNKLDHAPPYMAILVVCLLGIVKSIISFLVIRYKYTVDDYRIPFVIYTTCFSVSAILVTIVLNEGFQSKFTGYDLFQVIAGCYIASMLLMRTPTFIDRLYSGQVCPLREGEFLYALVHFGL